MRIRIDLFLNKKLTIRFLQIGELPIFIEGLELEPGYLYFRIIFFLLSLFPITYVSAQYEGLKRLQNAKEIVPEIVQYNPQLERFFDIDDAQADYMEGILQHLVKTSDGLFMLIDGTGRVYRIRWNGESPIAIRHDSTLFFGYNFGFQPFAYRDTLYSFGGYGFWKYNGHLRVFIEDKHEWDIEKLNREIHYTRVEYAAAPRWVDVSKGHLWIGYKIESREGVLIGTPSYRSVVDSVYMLNLQTKRWTCVGAMNDEVKIILQSQVSRSLGSSPWGQLVHYQEKSAIHLLDFDRNKMFALNENKYKAIANKLRERSYLFFIDSTLFLGTRTGSLDSVLLSRSDFATINGTIYHGGAPILKSSAWTWVGIGIAALCAIGFYVNKIRSSKEMNGNKPHDARDYNEMFDEKEMELIRLMSSHSKQGNSTSIEEVNKLLGVEHKTLEVQKKQRSDVLLEINRKWAFANNTKEPLIRKKRLEKDRRSVEYFISYEDVMKLNHK